jgi:hypothetical protein
MKPVMARWRQAGFVVLGPFTLALALLAVPASGQASPGGQPASARAANAPPTSPQQLVFDISPDHAVVDPAGPRVIKYIVEFASLDGGKLRTLDLGKPDAPDGTITVPLAQADLPDGRYVATVRVIGSVASVTSATIGPFQIGKARRAKSGPEQTSPAPTAAPPTRAPATEPSAAPTDDAARRGFWKRIYGLIVG